MLDAHPAPSSSRRALLKDGCLVLASPLFAGLATNPSPASEPADSPPLRIALVTDLHYADKPPAGTRHYRATLDKFAEAVDRFRAEKLDLIIELGDLIDAADTPQAELGYLRRINQELSALPCRRHYVLGNHCVSTLTKDEFLGQVEQERSYSSFDVGGYHLITLDACFRADGQPYGRNNFEWTDSNIPAAQLEWLEADLAATPRPTLVFTHQRLDVDPPYGIRNAPAVRKRLERSGKVRAVFQGHSHKNDLHEIAGIPYVTLVAMVEGPAPENNAYSILELNPSGLIHLQGFRHQHSQSWPPTPITKSP